MTGFQRGPVVVSDRFREESHSKAAARAPGMPCSISRACIATLCSQSTSYLVATVWVIEVKSVSYTHLTLPTTPYV